MSLTDDELDAEKRRPRPSLDAQRYNFTPKMSPITSPTTTSTNSTTFLLPILLPATAVLQANVTTQPFHLKELSGQADGRPSSSATPYIPQEIANADLAIAADRTFLETTSALAARELKKYYEKMGGETSRKGRRLRTPYLITSLEVNGEQRFRVSIRTDSEHFQESSVTPSGRPPSLIPAIGGLISSVMAGGGRNSLPGGPRHTLRRPRSISEPRESIFYASAPPTGIVGAVGGFVDPFSSTRRSLDYRSSSMDGDTTAPGSSDPYIHRRPEIGNSPFGPGVIYTEPAVPTSPEMPTFSTNPSLREVQSFESNLTAKPDPLPPAKFYATSQLLMKKDSILTAASRDTTPFSTIVFDILQTFRGAPLPDRLSESSSEPTVKLSSSSSAVPRDDPRFVIWGEVYSNVFEEQTTSQGSHTDLSTSSHSGVSPRRKTSHARSGDIPVIFNSSAPERLIVAATIERWIAQLTSENESFELVHFFITYRIYISGPDLCHLLICRFHWALEKPNSKQDEVIRAQVRARTYKMIRYWLSHWFKVDFSTNPQLCQVLINWVNTLRKDPVMSKLPDALDIVRRIKKLIRDCKQEAEIGKELESKGKDPPSRPNSSAPISQSDPESTTARKSESVFKTSSESSSRGPLPSLDVTTNAMVPASVGSLDLPPSLSILPPQRTSLSPAPATMGMLQQPLHMTIWAQTNSSLQAPAPYTVAIPSGLPTQHGSISRALVNTMGKLGRWKRVLNSRSAPVQSQLDCSGIASFDIEQGYAGDLQIFRQSYGDIGPHMGPLGISYIPNDIIPPNDVVHEFDEKRTSALLSTLEETTESDAGTKTPQPSILLPRTGSLLAAGDAESAQVTASMSEEGPVAELPCDPRPSISDERSSEITAQPADATRPEESTTNGEALETSCRHLPSASTDTHVDAEPTEDVNEAQTNDQFTPQKVHLPPSTDGSYGSETIAGASNDTRLAHQSIASSAGDGDANSFFDSSEEDYGNPISSGAAWFPTGRSLNSNDFVDMDEYLSSDEDGPNDAPAQLRKAIRRLPHQRDLKFVSRIDSLSSRESPAAVTSVHSSVNVEEDDQSSVGHVNDPNSRKVFAWQLDYIIDSEEDEPRDVEAALRRLEGHVDRDRQHKKETKIDGWLRQVKQRKALQFTQADAADDDAVEVQSSRDGMESDDVLETPPDDSREMDGAQIEEHPHPPLPREMQGQREMDRVHPDLGRETVTTAVEQHQSHPFPSVHAPSMRRGSEEGAATIEWPESTVTHRAHKNSQSLSHRASFVKISGARAHTTPSHESFVLMNRSLKIAQHLTAIESEIWRHIPIEDLLGIPPSVLDPSPPDDILDWGEYLKQRTGTNGVNINSSGRSLNGLVMARDRFWITAMWAASEILLTRPNLRPMLVSKFIRVALKCYTLNNFSSLVAIIIGLSLPAVERAIKRMPKGIGLYELRIFEGLKSFSSDDGNYRLIRETLAALIAAHKSQSPMESSSTATSADVSRACIPPIGIYLRQLTKLDRLPDYVDPTAPTEPVEDDPHGGLSQPRHPEVFANLAPLPAEMTLEPLINVHKQRLISGVVLSFVNCQQLTGKYKFPMDRKLHQRCLRLRALTMETLEDFSNWE